ncbi:grhN [Kineococcus sp. T13]|uniref:grhN n=1 Tax=Kineococcus vitellinus TaxID=2696565 RepID=UPI0014123462|nr:grhN [Kineococcus vitellinus]NAZ77621.1 grhN [Kineococcus vitellinus]
MDPTIQDRRPPRWLTRRIVNPLVRRLAPTRFGSRLPVAVLRVTGRRSGRRFEVPVGVHDVDGRRLIFTDAPWRLNLRGGAPAELLEGGRLSAVRATLVEDPAQVGALFRAAFAAGTGPERIALRIAPGHAPGDEELAAHRHVVLLEQDPSPAAPPGRGAGG